MTGPTLENATVIVTDGKIAAVGAGLTPPAGATVVPCAGKHLYPGLISSNTILGLVEVGSVLGTHDDEETGNVNPNIRAEVEINPESEILPVTRVSDTPVAAPYARACVSHPGYSCATTLAIDHATAECSDGNELPPG